MRNGGDECINLFVKRISPRSANLMRQVGKEASVNFASTYNIVGVPRHGPAAIFTHPLQIMRIVPTNLKSPGVPRPKALTLRAKHLVTTLRLVNENLAIRAGFSVLLQQCDGCNRVGIANMCIIIPGSLEFPAMCTSVLVASGTLPSGRHKAIAIGISTAMDKLLNVFNMVVSLANQPIFGLIQIDLQFL